ncbi:NAD(P)H dehydrogenase (quinone) [Hydrogenispora ethanolica]|jgi:NAD(P)H dehydrogenase (quinone)|uniref:NAD(P)H dehydrogenase (Quinone) n=1 Tax=Hydrogenispora ethanolica TaxID=1082276 RepID=A0A4R1RW77_HYDET|nr:flavodoxin family protein [Hydrogenispora ethanolica]TCL70943.1 NAD(P)H dehydrogenase (quinone) [Hydrogenispora ethanolica]
MKIAIIYHSQGGNTKKVAQLIAEGAKISEAIEVAAMSIGRLDEEFINEAKAVIFGCPTYYGTFSWQMKKWFDTTKIDLEGKLGSVFATENYLGGGADVAELGLIGHMLIRGMLVYSAGCAKAGPITHYGAVTIKDGDEWQQRRARLLGKRVAEKAWELFAAGQ